MALDESVDVELEIMAEQTRPTNPTLHPSGSVHDLIEWAVPLYEGDVSHQRGRSGHEDPDGHVTHDMRGEIREELERCDVAVARLHRTLAVNLHEVLAGPVVENDTNLSDHRIFSL